VIPASPERLWEALSDPGLLRGWFGGEFEWELREGSPLRFRADEGGSREGRVDEVRPERRLRFVWWPEGEDDDASEVSYLIEPLDDGVRLTVQERPVQEAPLSDPAGVPTAEACASGMPAPGEVPARVGTPHWTAWDTRLAGAWAGVAEVVARARS
jgi:uncharacterized protein YndB with AHSA1/START domain